MGRATWTQWQGEPFLALDIETRVCEQTYGRLRERIRTPIQHVSLCEITCISVLECCPGEPWTFRLKTFAASEERNLEELSKLLMSVPDFSLLTFNGRRHDLPAIELRAIHHIMFSVPGLSSLSHRAHYDLMDLVGGHCSLGSLRACFGLQPDEVFLEPTKRTKIERKCEIDVVTTFLSFLHLVAHRSGDPNLLLCAWSDLSRHFEQIQHGYFHLTPIVHQIR